MEKTTIVNSEDPINRNNGYKNTQIIASHRLLYLPPKPPYCSIKIQITVCPTSWFLPAVYKGRLRRTWHQSRRCGAGALGEQDRDRLQLWSRGDIIIEITRNKYTMENIRGYRGSGPVRIAKCVSVRMSFNISRSSTILIDATTVSRKHNATRLLENCYNLKLHRI